MAVAHSILSVGGRVAVCLLGIFFPVVEVGRVFDIFFEIGDCSAVWTEEVGPCWAVQNRADAFVVPDMRAGCDEQRLARLRLNLVQGILRVC